jgi:ADP-ribosylarginine hydrolase
MSEDAIDNKLMRYQATMVLHAVGDTIGFKNGDWEFKFEETKSVSEKETREYKMRRFESIPVEKLYEFIYLGGVNHIPDIGWNVSDDTILHMKTAEALLEDFSSMHTLGEHFRTKFIESWDSLVEDNMLKRYPGITTLDNIKKLINGTAWNQIPYDYYAGGSGASMRNLCIGLAYPGKENRDKLVQTSIEASRITHNSAIGYLGGMVSALFTAFAIEGIETKKWPFMLIELFDSGLVMRYIKKAGRDVGLYDSDAHIFVAKWVQYMEDKFDENKEPKKRRSDMNVVHRTRYYHENFAFMKERLYFPGSGGDDSVIIAYDCLLDAGQMWEKLVVYAMLHGGDTDTTGCIAAGWWGASYGYTDVPKNATKHLEFHKELEQLGTRLFNKFTQ